MRSMPQRAAASSTPTPLVVFSMEVHRGEVFYADLSPVVGSEQGGIRPVLIIQRTAKFFTLLLLLYHT